MWINSFGLGTIQGWLWLFFLNGPLLYGITDKSGIRPENVFFTFLLFNSVSFLLISKIGRTVFQFTKKPLVIILSTLFMIAGTLVTGLAAKGIDVFSYNLIIVPGALMAGCGSSMLISAWGERYSTFSAHKASLSFGFAVTIGTVLFFIISKLPLPVSVAITAFIPFISMILLLRKTGTVTEPELTNPIRQAISFPFPIRLILLIILFYLAGGLMHKMIAAGQQLGFYESFWLTNIVYFAVCLSAGAIIYLIPSLDLSFLYRPILPLLGIGFLLFPSLYNSYPVVPFTFLQTGFALFDLYTWLLFVYLAARHRFPVSVIAWGMFLITSSIFAGELLFTRLISATIVSVKEPELVSLIAALLMFIGTLVFRSERETFSGWDYPSAPVEPDLHKINVGNQALNEMACTSSDEIHGNFTTDEMPTVVSQQSTEQRVTVEVPQEVLPVEQFALRHNLTPREKQILVLLLEGRNNPYIREDLNISNNTLKTHLRNIFRKLSIGDRQELLDLYGEFKESLL